MEGMTSTSVRKPIKADLCESFNGLSENRHVTEITFQDVLDAIPRVQAVLKPTALIEWGGLCQRIGAKFLLKHENHQPVGAFKVRGGVNLVSTLSDAERASGILGCSTGNHGQSLAFAARRFGTHCTIVVPKGNNPDKSRAMTCLGAEVIEHGRDFDAAREYLESTVQPERGGRYVHSANEPLLIGGVGTMAVEIFDDCPAPDVILVPIGLGSGVCGTCIVAKTVRPATRVIGVQAERANAVAESWRARKIIAHETCHTWAEGLATRVPARLTMDIMWKFMDDVITVSDIELRRACRWILEDTHNLAEGAGAATLAAAYKMRDQLKDQTVVGVLSGGNLDLSELPGILNCGDH